MAEPDDPSRSIPPSPEGAVVRPGFVRALIAQLRIHQWAKNALVVVPVLLAPGVPSNRVIAHALLAALTFSFCASAGYVLNDLLDLEADRAHPTKRHRPFASGALPVSVGPALFVALLVASFGPALAVLPRGFAAMLAIYFGGTLAYSLYFKRQLLLDVLVLAGLYTHRILAGGVATSIPISQWLLAFSVFLFLSLAFAKRHVEIAPLGADQRIKNRNYGKSDLSIVESMGTASGYLGALVFTLYVENGAHGGAYKSPAMLWAAAPVLLYWISRIWVLTSRGEMNDDPVRFALTDRVSLVCGAVVALIAAVARFAEPSALSILGG
ncbi:MAG: UbiA family prenyltransferase [Polyangiales bacterium]